MSRSSKNINGSDPLLLSLATEAGRWNRTTKPHIKQMFPFNFFSLITEGDKASEMITTGQSLLDEKGEKEKWN